MASWRCVSSLSGLSVTDGRAPFLCHPRRSSQHCFFIVIEYYRAMVQQSTYRLATILSLVAVALLIIGVVVVNKGFRIDPSSSARSTVLQFGTEMQKVSLLSSDAT